MDAVHLDQLREHGGLPGIRDENALESALARPRNKWAYKRSTDLAALAAAYGFGLVTVHPYRDGNKRIAFLTMAVFLGLNGLEIEAEESEVVAAMVAAANHGLTERQLSRWISSHMVSLK